MFVFLVDFIANVFWWRTLCHHAENSSFRHFPFVCHQSLEDKVHKFCRDIHTHFKIHGVVPSTYTTYTHHVSEPGEKSSRFWKYANRGTNFICMKIQFFPELATLDSKYRLPSTASSSTPLLPFFWTFYSLFLFLVPSTIFPNKPATYFFLSCMHIVLKRID